MPFRMPKKAVLDTCILAKSTPRGILFEAANRGLFQPLWSERTLGELKDYYIKRRNTPPPRAQQYVDQIRRLFPEAEVRATHVPGAPMAYDPGDQHVVNAALIKGAEFLVTDNIRDFPVPELKLRGVQVVTCDEFLMELMQDGGEEMVTILFFYADYGIVPPENVLTIVERLKHSDLPVFAESLRRRLK